MRTSVWYTVVMVLALLFTSCNRRSLSLDKQDVVECQLPAQDVPGENPTDFPRPPNTVRVSYGMRNDYTLPSRSGRFSGLAITYRTLAGFEEIVRFYQARAKDEGWRIQESNYGDKNFFHMIMDKDKKHLFVSIRPYEELITPVKSTRGQVPPEIVYTGCYSIYTFSWEE